MRRTIPYYVDPRTMLVHYRGWQLSLTLGWPTLDLAMDEIDRLIRRSWGSYR